MLGATLVLMRTARATVHPCHFYSDDAAFATTVASFLAPAFREGQAIVAFGTPAHLDAIEKRLKRDGYDIDAAKSRGQYQPNDAQAALEALVVGELPVQDVFDEVIGSRVSQAVREFGGVRAFGEIVSLLWRDGKRQAALRLEEMWNDAIGLHPLSLLCGYNVRSFTSAHDAAGVTGIINAHSSVLAKTA
jgi:hypothetical protein